MNIPSDHTIELPWWKILSKFSCSNFYSIYRTLFEALGFSLVCYIDEKLSWAFLQIRFMSHTLDLCSDIKYNIYVAT